MKKIIICIVFIILGFVLIGCSNDNDKELNNEFSQEENFNNTFIIKSDPAEVLLNIDEINCVLKYSAKGTLGYKYNDEGKSCYFSDAFVESRTQLVVLCNEYNNKIFDGNNAENLTKLSTLLKSLDEDYFLDKNLIIFSFWTGNMSKHDITNCSIIDDTLNLDVIESYKNDDYIYTLESYLYLVILEVDKLETLNINTLNINYKKGS